MRGGLLRALKHLAPRKPSPEPGSIADLLRQAPPTSDGFGAWPFIGAIRLSEPEALSGDPVPPLKGVQVLTRYCSIEQPYWKAFVRHYASLGAEAIQVCVQREAEEQELRALRSSTELDCIVHRMRDDKNPSVALRSFDVGRIRARAPYTLLVDCDEHFHALNPLVSLGGLGDRYPDIGQMSIPWLMCPLAERPLTGTPKGFWGNAGKPVVRSAMARGFRNDHLFLTADDPSSKPDITVPIGPLGHVVVHYWARSFRDCLLKTFNTRFQDAKTADRTRALAMIRAGDLPIRLRLLAYLEAQHRYLAVPEPGTALVEEDCEEALLRLSLSEADEAQCKETYASYARWMKTQLLRFPIYPSIGLLQLSKLLPSPLELPAP